MATFSCLRCGCPTTVRDISKSDGLCDSCDGTYDPAPSDPLRNLKVSKDLPPGKYEVYIKDGEVVTSNVPTREAGTYYDPASVKANIDGQLRALRCIEALQELVRLKDLKTQIEMWVRDEVSGHQWPKMPYEDRMKASDEYRRCKGAAWDNARKALGE